MAMEAILSFLVRADEAKRIGQLPIGTWKPLVGSGCGGLFGAFERELKFVPESGWEPLCGEGLVPARDMDP